MSINNYDELKGFIDYTNKEEWKNYIEKYVIPIWKNAFILKSFSEKIVKEFNNASLQEIDKEDLPLLIGGIIPSKEVVYKKNSLAKFYDNFFGLKLRDIQSWILGGKTEIPLEVIVEETAFTRFVNKIYSLSNEALSNQTLIEYSIPELNYIELKRNPEKIMELIKDFLQSILNISINYNYYTFFLWSIKQIPYKFMKKAYPRIDKIIEFLENEFGLTEFKWEIPFVRDSELYREYTIWCWPEYQYYKQYKGKSFGGSICMLNEIIWEHLTPLTDLGKILFEYFAPLPDLKNEYISRIKKSTDWIIIFYRRISAGEEYSKVGELTIMDMIDKISSDLFTGLKKITDIGSRDKYTKYISLSSI